MTKDVEREQRLAEALRANLRRRKAQLRGETENRPAPDEPKEQPVPGA